MVFSKQRGEIARLLSGCRTPDSLAEETDVGGGIQLGAGRINVMGHHFVI